MDMITDVMRDDRLHWPFTETCIVAVRTLYITFRVPIFQEACLVLLTAHHAVG